MGITDLTNQTITVKNPGTTRDKHGNAILGSSASIAARFQRTNKTIVTANKEREPIDGIVFVAAGADVQIGAQVIYDSEKYRVITKADQVIGSGAVHHKELMVQLWSYAA